MGIINQGILGGLRKKVGNVVGSSWKGIPVLRIYQPVVANPRTAAQVTVRTGFKGLAELASLVLAAFIKPLWDRFAVRMSGYNSFMKANKALVAEGADPYTTPLVASKGKMDATQIEAASINSAGITVEFSPTPVGRYALASDKAFLLVLNQSQKNVIFAGQPADLPTRGDGAAEVDSDAILNAPSVGDTCIVYLSFMREDGTVISDSSYTTTTAA